MAGLWLAETMIPILASGRASRWSPSTVWRPAFHWRTDRPAQHVLHHVAVEAETMKFRAPPALRGSRRNRDIGAASSGRRACWLCTMPGSPRPVRISAWEDQFNLSLDPETARDFHDGRLLAERPPTRCPFLLHVRPEMSAA